MESELRQFYENYDEEGRLLTRQGNVEFTTTMHFIDAFLKPGMRILEVGAATGRYSHTLARRGFRVDAVELVEHNIEVFNSLTRPGENVTIRQGNAVDLSFLEDNTFDMTLILGPMYHLFKEEDRRQALREAVRVTKKGGIIFTAYCMLDASLLCYAFARNEFQNLLRDGRIDECTFLPVYHPVDQFFMTRKDEIDSLREGLGVTQLHFAAADGYAKHMEAAWPKWRKRPTRAICATTFPPASAPTWWASATTPSTFSERTDLMLNHKGTQTIETDRLILRRFTMADAEPMYRNWASDDAVTKHLTWPTHASVEVTKMVLTDWTGSYHRDDFYNWAIILKENGPEPIGSIAAVHVNEKTLSAAMGYCMGRAHWGKGVMSEALTALIGFLFDEVGFNRIEADHDPNNPGSGRVMQKSGMTYEGTMRSYGLSNQGIIDVSRWAILRSDRQGRD